MSMEEDLITLLRRSPVVAEIVGTRISQDVRPQRGNDPAIVINRLTGAHEHDLLGSAGYAAPTFHVMCFTNRATTANRLRDAVREAMQGFSGVVGDTKFGSITLDDEDHDYIEPLDDSDQGTYARLLVFQVLHLERVPTFS